MVDVVYSKETSESGQIMLRVAKIDGKFWPYKFSTITGRVTRRHAFAGHSESGVTYVSEPYDTLEAAIAAL